MRVIVLLVLVAIMGGAATAQLRKFQPGRYAAADGALVLNNDGNYVDPYFSTKALLVAMDSGLDVKDTALPWINWLLPRQGKDGRFGRYCLKNSWLQCKDADADDATLALWLELLYRTAPDSGLPAEWQRSAEESKQYLATLRNGRLGVYHVSHREHTALFMDNVEVYSAIAHMAQADRRFGDTAAASADDAAARDLAKSIEKVFWNKRADRFVPANQKTRPAFYPDVVAQTYPWLAGMPTPEGNSQQAWERWRNVFAPMWLTNRYDPHAWGLVAVAALKMHDTRTAGCWLNLAAVHRGDADWNILEEAAYQSVNAALAPAHENLAADCSGLVRGQ